MKRKNVTIAILILTGILTLLFGRESQLLGVSTDQLIGGTGDVWTSIGPSGGGWLMALAFAPPNTIYVGCDVGGMYRSTDGGDNWNIINRGLKDYYITAIAVDPLTPTTVYAGTLGGVYKSTDGGDHWEKKRSGFPAINLGFFSEPISSLAIDPTNTDVVYAGIGPLQPWHEWVGDHTKSYGMIYKSENGAESWEVVLRRTESLTAESAVYSIAVDPQSSDTLYAGTNFGFYKSADGGTTWEPRNTGLLHTDTRKVIIHPSNSNVLYLTIHSTPGQPPWRGGVYKSVDGGNSWVPKVNGLSSYVGSGDALHTSNYESIVIHPQQPDTLYVGDISWDTAGVYKTTNGGDNWFNTIGLGNWEKGWVRAGASVNCLLIDPVDPDRLFFGTSMGLYRSDDGGATWQQTYTDESPSGSDQWQGRGLETTVALDVTVDPVNSNNIYFGFRDVGFLRSFDGGTTFQQVILSPTLEYGHVFEIVVDPDSPNVLYASDGNTDEQGTLFRSTDFGATWMPLSGLPDAPVHALVLDRSSPIGSRTLYAASYGHGVFKSGDGGATWTAANDGLQNPQNMFVSSLVLDPTDPDVLYVGLDMQTLQSNDDSDRYGGIYKTTTGGAWWIQIDTGIPDVRSLAINPQNPQILYAGARSHYDHPNRSWFDGPWFDGGVFKSTDGGQTWGNEPVFFDPFVSTVVVDPNDPRIVYAATTDHPFHDESTGHGVYRSIDGGITWQAMNDGLGMWSVNALEIAPNTPNLLYVGTGGGGLFRGLAPDVYFMYLPLILHIN